MVGQRSKRRDETIGEKRSRENIWEIVGKEKEGKCRIIEKNERKGGRNLFLL